MNAQSILKFLTGVMFLLTVSSANAESEEKAMAAETPAQCRQYCIAFANKESDPTKQASLRDNCIAKAGCTDKEAPESSKEKKQACTEATKEWQTHAPKAAGACNSFEKTSTSRDSQSKCEERVEKCRKLVNEAARTLTSKAASETGGPNPEDGVTNMLMQFYAQKNGITPSQFRTDGNLLQTTNCVKFSNDKTEARKDKNDAKLDKIDDKIKSAKEKKSRLEKEIAEENEKLRKETATIDEEKQKIEATFQENIQKIAVSNREKYTALNKSIQDNLAKIKKVNNDLIDRKAEMEKIKFDFNQKMIQFAEDKVDAQCKNAVETAQSCFVRSAKGKLDPKDSSCNGLTFSGKGVKGTNVLVKRLTQIRDACFEQVKMGESKARFDHQTILRANQDQIRKAQDQIAMINDEIKAEKTTFDSLSQEAEKEKTNETAAKDQKNTNLGTKLEGVTKTINEKIKVAQDQMAELDKEIQELVLRKLPGRLGIVPNSNGDDIQYAFDQAEEVIETAEKARSIAESKCDCDNPDKKDDKTCTMLKKASTSFKNNRGLPATRVVRPKTEK